MTSVNNGREKPAQRGIRICSASVILCRDFYVSASDMLIEQGDVWR